MLDLTNCAVLQSLFLQNVSTNAVSGTTISVNGYDQAASLKFSVANTPFKTLSIVNSSVLTALNVLSNDNLEIFNGYGNTALTNLSLSPYFKEVHAYGCSVLEGTDVSDISGLTVLDFHGCNLQTLDVDSNPEIVTLDCSSNQLTKLNVDNNTGLVTLKVNGNNLTQFKVANNTALETLWVSDNQLSAINVRSNTALKDLRMSNNVDITALNLKSNTALETLYADGLSISEINLVENAMLSMFSFTDNLLLTSIQVSSDFSMDNCLFTSVGNNGVLSIVNTKGESFYYVGQYSTVCGDGVVYQITNGGKNAQLISMEETSASWSSAKSWCSSYGDGKWYLPTKDQLMDIYYKKSTLNSTLSACGGTILDTVWHWSSTEYNTSDAYGVNFYYGSTPHGKKSQEARVRAVRAL